MRSEAGHKRNRADASLDSETTAQAAAVGASTEGDGSADEAHVAAEAVAAAGAGGERLSRRARRGDGTPAATNEDVGNISAVPMDSAGGAGIAPAPSAMRAVGYRSPPGIPAGSSVVFWAPELVRDSGIELGEKKNKDEDEDEDVRAWLSAAKKVSADKAAAAAAKEAAAKEAAAKEAADEDSAASTKTVSSGSRG